MNALGRQVGILKIPFLFLVPLTKLYDFTLLRGVRMEILYLVILKLLLPAIGGLCDRLLGHLGGRVWLPGVLTPPWRCGKRRDMMNGNVLAHWKDMIQSASVWHTLAVDLSWPAVGVTKACGYGKVCWRSSGAFKFSLTLLRLVQPGGEFECLSVLVEHSQDVKSIVWHPFEEV